MDHRRSTDDLIHLKYLVNVLIHDNRERSERIFYSRLNGINESMNGREGVMLHGYATCFVRRHLGNNSFLLFVSVICEDESVFTGGTTNMICEISQVSIN